MAEVKFYLDRRKGIKADIPIYLSYFFNGNRFKYYTGKKVDLKNFNVKKGEVKTIDPNSEAINDRLKLLKTEVDRLYNTAIALKQVPTVQYFKDGLNLLVRPKKNDFNVIITLNEYQIYISKNKAANTLKNSITAINHFKNFIGKKTAFADINTITLNKFNDYLVGLELKNNSVVKNLSVIRTFFKWVTDNDYFDYSALKFPQMAENEIDVIFLTEAEINQLRTFDLKNSSLEAVRDCFIFGCYTGLRHSDLYQLKKSDILWPDNEIRFYITKSHETKAQTVPLIPLTIDILEKYKDIPGDKALPIITNQKMNFALKTVCRLAGLNEKITIATKAGSGKINKTEFEKWQLVTCHTSRKSFITLAMAKGMPEAIIKSITGHQKDSKSFIKYYEVMDTQKHEAMKKIF